MLLLGLDPGLNRTGYAVLEVPRKRLVEGGVIRSSAAETLAERCLELRNGLLEVLREHEIDAAAIEQVFSLPKNPKTAVLMAHGRGALLATLAECSLLPEHYTPRQIKKLLTGSGAATKEQVQRAVQMELALRSPLEPNDVADAAAIALCLAGDAVFKSATRVERD